MSLQLDLILTWKGKFRNSQHPSIHEAELIKMSVNALSFNLFFIIWQYICLDRNEIERWSYQRTISVWHFRLKYALFSPLYSMIISAGMFHWYAHIHHRLQSTPLTSHGCCCTGYAWLYKRYSGLGKTAAQSPPCDTPPLSRKSFTYSNGDRLKSQYAMSGTSEIRQLQLEFVFSSIILVLLAGLI